MTEDNASGGGTSGPRPVTRLWTEEDLGPGLILGLDHARAHFLRSVLRLERGAPVALFNGRHGEWLARIEGLGKGWCSLAVEAQRRLQAAGPDLWLVFAPIKRARLDFLVEKATELGCAALQPMMTRHTAVSRVNLERLQANAREAAEQCERLDLPEIHPVTDFGKLLDAWPRKRRLLVCAESGAAQPIAAALLDLPRNEPKNGPGPWAIMTGPEGGFARSELDALNDLSFVIKVGLGPRVLRADTAALAAIASWQAILGDGRSRPPLRDGD